MRRYSHLVKAVALVAAIGAIAWTASSFAKGGGPLGCPRDVGCPDIYDPVWCDQGMFPNACYAWAACATNCGGAGS